MSITIIKIGKISRTTTKQKCSGAVKIKLNYFEPTVAFTAFADLWPRAIEKEIGATHVPLGTGKDFDLTFEK